MVNMGYSISERETSLFHPFHSIEIESKLFHRYLFLAQMTMIHYGRSTILDGRVLAHRNRIHVESKPFRKKGHLVAELDKIYAIFR